MYGWEIIIITCVWLNPTGEYLNVAFSILYRKMIHIKY